MTFQNFRYTLEFAPVWVTDKILCALPRPLCLKAGEWLGRMVSFLFVGRNKLMRANLQKTFPEKSYEEREGIRKGVWRNLGRVIGEFVRLSDLTPENYLSYMLVDNGDLVEKAKAQGKGVIFVGFHFTNWEITGVGGKLVHGNIVAVARPIKNPYVDRWVWEKRGLGGMEVILHRQAVKGCLKALKEKKSVGILVDQNLYTGGVFADFLGRPAATTPLPALLHNRTGAPVILLYCLREAGKIRLIVEAAPKAKEGSDPLLGLTQAINDRFGELVRKYPANWFWLHNRWKRQPS